MNIGIIGSGGREHSICVSLKKSKKINQIYCYPGNAGTDGIANNINIDLEQVLGATTLSGDKLLNYFINDGESKLIFLAVEDEAKPNKAIIFEGLEAVHYIEKNVSGVVKR